MGYFLERLKFHRKDRQNRFERLRSNGKPHVVCTRWPSTHHTARRRVHAPDDTRTLKRTTGVRTKWCIYVTVIRHAAVALAKKHSIGCYHSIVSVRISLAAFASQILGINIRTISFRSSLNVSLLIVSYSTGRGLIFNWREIWPKQPARSGQKMTFCAVCLHRPALRQ